MRFVHPSIDPRSTHDLSFAAYLITRQRTLPIATLAHAIELSGTFSKEIANGYALLDYPPCWHLAEFRSDRLTRFLRLNRANLRLAFGQERGDHYWQTLLLKRRYPR